jgi:hypothetical protein
MSQEVEPAAMNVSTQSGVVSGQPRLWLGLEAASVFIVAIAAYAHGSHSWLLFAAVFLLPDVSFLGYLAGSRFGAVSYNVAHTYAVPLILAAALYIAGRPLSIPLIWISHIGFDRMLGYGLKYDLGFGFTHLGRLRKAQRKS